MEFIWENGRRHYRDPTVALLSNAYFHHDKYPTTDIMQFISIDVLPINNSILVKKSSHQYMNRPFGQCFDYQIPNDLTYNSLSYIECYRKCFKTSLHRTMELCSISDRQFYDRI